jgi:hypothetical protein
MVPKDPKEHRAMIAKLIAGGTLAFKAENIISARKTGFIKVNRKYKKTVVEVAKSKHNKTVAKSMNDTIITNDDGN